MADDDVASVYKWYVQLQRTCSDQDIIEQIMTRMRAQNDRDAVTTLAFILSSEFVRQDRYGEAENILLNLSAQDPADPYALIRLAEQKLHFERQPEEALKVIERALERAHASEDFRRMALGVKARAARQLGRYDLVADMLRAIMAIKVSKGHVDIGIERDFLDRLPAGAIDAGLWRQYDEFCRSRGAS